MTQQELKSYSAKVVSMPNDKLLLEYARLSYFTGKNPGKTELIASRVKTVRDELMKRMA